MLNLTCVMALILFSGGDVRLYDHLKLSQS
jgi:hypothetical protein